MNHYTKNGELSNNTLHKTTHTRSSISYRVGLDPDATSYLVCWIERTRNFPHSILSNYITYHEKEPPMKL